MQQRFKLTIPTRVPRMSIEDPTKEIGWMDGPPEEHTFELEIDLERIKKRLGLAAHRNRTGRSAEMSGMIVCKKVKRPAV